jgi:ketosteroid isomerase-like protein
MDQEIGMTEINVLETINGFWHARLADDIDALRSFMTPDATYEMVGANAFADLAAVGPSAAKLAVDRLVDAFHFHSREQITAIVDGLSAATVARFEVSFRGGPPVKTEACDVWKFDAAGKITSLREFVDTDLVCRVMEGGSGGL